MRFSSSLARAAIGAIAGAVVALVVYVALFGSRSTLVLDMDQEHSPLLAGFWNPEVDGATTFAWTKARGDVVLGSLNRKAPWTCVVRLKGARPDGVPEPSVDLAVDGVVVSTTAATPDFSDLTVTIPAASRTGATLSIASAPTFRAPPDPRELGVAVDAVTCRPPDRAWAMPVSSLRDATLAAVLWGAAVGWVCPSLAMAVPLVVLVAGAEALPLTAGVAPYTPYATAVVWLACWTVMPAAVLIAALERARGRLTASAKFVVMFSAAVLYLKLLGLLHPGKILEDALFHAHNLEKFAGGRWFFTQGGLPNGVQFPYAVALYAFAEPWMRLTHSPMAHVALLRIVVCAADVIAGGLLYAIVTRIRGDRVAGVVAVALYQLLPVSYGMQGNGNLTNDFGQSVAVVAMAAAVTWSFTRWRLAQLGVLILLVSTALLSHVSVVSSLLPTLVLLSAFFWWLGGESRTASKSILAATVTSALIAVALYYGRLDHFGVAYQSLQNTRGTATVPITMGLKQVELDLGLAIIVAAVAGVWVLWTGARDRVFAAALSWLTGFGLLFIASLFKPTAQPFVRYTLEFISRADAIAAAGTVICAALAVSWAWRSGMMLRLLGAGVLAWAAMTSVPFWSAWFE